jgi:hypothetical protein
VPPGPLRANGLWGNIVTAGAEATAWFVLPQVRWSFRSAGDQYANILAHTAQLGRLTGMRCRIRVTSRPFPVSLWAQELDRDVRSHGGPMKGPCAGHPYRSEPGCGTCRPGHAWIDWLLEQQKRVSVWGTGDKVIYVGVDLHPRGSLPQMLGLGKRGPDAGLTDAGRARIAAAADRVTQVVTAAGLGALPATPYDMHWLFLRSSRPHLPLPKKGDPCGPPQPAEALNAGELAQFTAGVSVTCEPFARTATVTGPDGSVRHIAVVVINRVRNQPLPDGSPWLQRLDLLPFPVEASVTFDVLHPARVQHEMHKKLNVIDSQSDHFTQDQGRQPPAALSRQHDAARQIEDEAEHGNPALGAQVIMWARVAVSGATPEEALHRAHRVAEDYSPQISVAHPAGQFRLVRELIPGEPLATSGYAVPMPARLLAAGMPAVSTAVGHRHGFPLGTTSRLASRAVMFSLFHAMETNKSGLVTITGGLGSGKTTLGGKLMYMSARAGVPTFILDPSALLDQLCELPELAGHAMAVNLLHSPAGTLCPYALIGEPRLEDYEFDDHGRRRSPDAAERMRDLDSRAAEATRRQLVQDVLRMLLPPETMDKDRRDALDLAVMRAPAEAASSPLDVIRVLHEIADDGGSLGLSRDAMMAAMTLEGLMKHPWARLFFPPPDGAVAADVLAGDRLLTVVTLKGLTLPDGGQSAREWTSDQRLSVPIMHMAAFLTRRHALGRDRHHRKAVFIDEAHVLTVSAVGRAFLEMLARDSRKHNLVGILSSQLARDLTAAGLPGLVGATFTGRTEGAEEQAAALALAGLKPGQGHEYLLGDLSEQALHDPTAPKEFIVTDSEGGREVVRIDLGTNQGLREALNSTPTGRRPGDADPRAAAGDGT